MRTRLFAWFVFAGVLGFALLLVVRAPQVAAQPTLSISAPPLPLQSSPTRPQTDSIASSNVEIVGHIGGFVSSVVIQDNYAYLSTGRRLTILNLSDPTRPVLVGRSGFLPSPIAEVKVAGQYAYIADRQGGLRIFDISNPATPVEVGDYPASGNEVMVGIETLGSLAYVTVSREPPASGECDCGLHIVDISNPSAPARVGYYEYLGLSDVAVAGNYAYLATGYGGGFRILDVSNPATPTLLSQTGTRQMYSNGLAVRDNLVLVVGNENAHIFDVSNPATPTELSRTDDLADDVDGGSITLSGNYAYVSGDTLVTLDITDPSAPQVISRFPNINYTYETALLGNHLYAADGEGGLIVLDLTNQSQLTRVGCYCIPADANTQRIAISNNHAYFAEGFSGLDFVDVTVPENPTPVGYYRETFYDALNIIPINEYIYALCNGWKALDVSNPTAPIVIREDLPFSGRDIEIIGNHAYSGNRGVDVFNVSNPLEPQQIGSYQIDDLTYIEDVEVVDGKAYLTADLNNTGVYIVDVSTPSSPTLLGKYETRSAYSVAVSGNYAFLASYEGLHVLDVSDPSRPSQIGFYRLGEPRPYLGFGHPDRVIISGNHAYVSGRSLDGLYIFDISDPYHLVEVGSFQSGSGAPDVAVVGEYIYLAGGFDGLFILRFTPPAVVLRHKLFLPLSQSQP